MTSRYGKNPGACHPELASHGVMLELGEMFLFGGLGCAVVSAE